MEADSGSALDSGAPDAGDAGTDSGPVADSGEDAAMDSGADAEGDGGNGGFIEGGGCSCRTTGGTTRGDLAALPLVGLVLVLARRRRRG